MVAAGAGRGLSAGRWRAGAGLPAAADVSARLHDRVTLDCGRAARSRASAGSSTEIARGAGSTSGAGGAEPRRGRRHRRRAAALPSPAAAPQASAAGEAPPAHLSPPSRPRSRPAASRRHGRDGRAAARPTSPAGAGPPTPPPPAWSGESAASPAAHRAGSVDAGSGSVNQRRRPRACRPPGHRAGDGLRRRANVPSSACRSSAIDWKRAAGSFSSARAIARSIAGGSVRNQLAQVAAV